MSRAFVKEDSANQPEDPPERKPSGLPNYVTPSGKIELRRRIEALEETRKTLKAQNSDDPLLKQRLRQTERDLAYYEHRYKTAILVDNSGCGAAEARFGAHVAVKESSGTERTYVIVGEDEADAQAGKISWASPFASALLGAKPGAAVSWKRGTEEKRLEIISVTYPEAGSGESRPEK